MPGPQPGYQPLNERCLRELGVTLKQKAALVAAVSSWLLDRGPTCHRWVQTLLYAQGEHTHAGEELLHLSRKGLLVEVARIENEVFYRPTQGTLDKVLGWAGRHERAEGAAAE